jgi:hypothetical protein
MVGVVKTDAQELADIADTGPDALLTLNDGQICGIKRAQPCECCVIQRVACDITHMRRQITQQTCIIQKTGFFSANRAVAEKFHINS